MVTSYSAKCNTIKSKLLENLWFLDKNKRFANIKKKLCIIFNWIVHQKKHLPTKILA